jgi:1-acyl-sn-glycerol-3-phosphate acyltransferase
MNPFFEGDTYDTPEHATRKLFDKISFNSRLYFILGYIGIVLSARILVAQGRFDRAAWAQTSFNVLKLVEDCGGHVHTTGLTNIEKSQGPVVFISNHMSNLESSVLPSFILPTTPVSYVIKESITRYPIFGTVVGSQQPIPVSRTNPRADFQVVMTRGNTLLQNGRSIILFPQSTRTVTFNPDEFNSLGIKLAKKANVQVIPVAVKTDFWQNGRYFRDYGPIDRRQPVHFAFGEPFFIENSKQAHHHVINFIQSHLDKWQQSGGK